MDAVTPNCPRCAQPMVLRTGRGGSQFYGCSTYAKTRCRGIRQLDEVLAALADAEFDAGTAGGSAQREYERRVARREERVKASLGRWVGGALLALTDEPASTRAWRRGAAGERALAKALEGVEVIRQLHDRRVRGTRGNIDHLVIGPAGVFIVDAKQYSGLIEIRNVGGWFRRDDRLFVGGRDRSYLVEMDWQIEAVEAALANVDPAPPVTPVLCFINGEWPLLGATDVYAGVRLEGPKSLRKLVTKDALLAPEQVAELTRTLARAFPAK